MDDVRRRALQSVIDKLNLSFRATDILPIVADDHADRKRMRGDLISLSFALFCLVFFF